MTGVQTCALRPHLVENLPGVHFGKVLLLVTIGGTDERSIDPESAVIESHQGRTAGARLVDVVHVGTSLVPGELLVGPEVHGGVLDANAVLVAPQVQHLAGGGTEIQRGLGVEMDTASGTYVERVRRRGGETGVLTVSPDEGPGVIDPGTPPGRQGKPGVVGEIGRAHV